MMESESLHNNPLEKSDTTFAEFVDREQALLDAFEAPTEKRDEVQRHVEMYKITTCLATEIVRGES